MKIKKEWPTSAYNADGEWCVCLVGTDGHVMRKPNVNLCRDVPMTQAEVWREAEKESQAFGDSILLWGGTVYTFTAGKQVTA